MTATAPKLTFEVDTGPLQRTVVSVAQMVGALRGVGPAAAGASGAVNMSAAAIAQQGAASETSRARLVELIRTGQTATPEFQRLSQSINAATREMIAYAAAMDNGAKDATRYTMALKAMRDAAQAAEKAMATRPAGGGFGGGAGGMGGGLAEAAEQAQKLEKAAGQAGQRISATGTIMSGIVAGAGFAFIGFIGSAVSGLGAMALASGQATDNLKMLQAQLRFAFGGNADVGRRAQQDVLALARESGIDYNSMARQYADIAVSARGLGLGRTDVTGLTRSFQDLGQISGARPEQVGSALYQFQQAMSVGVLRGQDFRYMQQAMPGIDNALAAGMGVDVSRILPMVERGEISAHRMVEALRKGVEILKMESGDLPDTMQKAGNRLKTEWEVMLQNMGESLNSSGLVQGFTNMLAKGLKQAGERFDPNRRQNIEIRLGQLETLEKRGALLKSEREQIPVLRQRLAKMDEDADKEKYSMWSEKATGIMGAAAAKVEAGYNEANARDPYAGAIRELTAARAQQIDRLKYFEASGADPEKRKILEDDIARLTTMIARITTPFARFVQQTAAAMADLEKYGYAGAEFMERARSLIEAMEGRLSPTQALNAVLNQEVARTRALTERMATEGRSRQMVLASIGQGAEAERKAQLDARAMERRAGYSDELLNDPRVRARLAAEDDRDREQSSFDVTAQMRRAQGDNVIALDAARAQMGNVGNRRAALEAERAAELRLMERDLPDGAERDKLIAQRKERYAIEDATRRAEILSFEEKRLAAQQKQLDLGLKLGRDRRVALEMLRLEQEAREQIIELSEQEIEILARRNVAMSEQLEAQARKLRGLEAAGERMGQGVGDAFESSLRAAFDKSEDAGKAFLKSIERAALDTAVIIARAMIFDPIVKGVTDKSTGFLSSIFGGGGKLNAGAGGSSIPGLSGGGFAPADGGFFGVNPFPTIKFAFGGVVSRPTLFDMGGGMTGEAGEAGPEAIMPLRRGRDGRLGVAGGGGDVQVVINDMRQSSSEPVQVQQNRGPDGRRMIEVMIEDKMRQTVASGGMDGEMRARYGAQRAIKQV